MERSILSNLANYHLNSLNGKLNGSRKNNMHGSIWDQKRPKRKSIVHATKECFTVLLSVSLFTPSVKEGCGLFNLLNYLVTRFGLANPHARERCL